MSDYTICLGGSYYGSSILILTFWAIIYLNPRLLLKMQATHSICVNISLKP